MIFKSARHWIRLGLAGVAVSLLLVTACSDDDDNGSGNSGSTAAATATTAPPTQAAPETIEITAVDYAFQDVPQTVAVGTTFTLVNDSTVELHELVAVRIADTETRPVEELLELSDEELGGAIAEEPAMVIIAPPGSEGMAVVGDGSFTEPGRYALVCFIPTGADPQAFLDSAEEEEDGPPNVEGGPPHIVQGMFGQVIVE
ncbi:MAG: hypothetical protein GEU75_15260 [Dehalococcoidia bacterium]|nr:hypothetical protein [Dehalococcoidia bacterium]